jgi:tellurium resistance protein TerD
MSVNLTKGQKVNLSKEAPQLDAVLVGLGWDVKASGSSGADFDLDAIAFLLKGGKVKKDKDFIYFGNRNSECGAIQLSEDNLTGEGDGDDETIDIILSKVEPDVEKIAVVVNIYQAASRNQTFGMVDNAICRIVDKSNNKELAIFDLSFDASDATGLLFGEFIRRNNEWYFNAVGSEFKEGLDSICRNFGVDA